MKGGEEGRGCSLIISSILSIYLCIYACLWEFT